MVGAELLGDEVGVLELVAGLPARGVEADAERLQPGCPASASSATTRLESMPPESSTPTGTSATIRRSTAVRSVSSSASCQSRSVQSRAVGVAA